MRQGVLFILVGLMQVVIDLLVFVLLTALGLEIGVANVVARLSGAALGYALNGMLTFSGDAGRVISVGSGIRFLAAWVSMTAVGTLSLIGLNTLQIAAPWLMKLLVEANLAVVSFIVMRTWVYCAPGGQAEKALPPSSAML